MTRSVCVAALRTRMTPAVLRVRDDVLVMQTLMWPDEIREPAFSSLEDEYEWFISAMPQQQIALVPGTFFIYGRSPYAARNILYGYFDYANRMKRVCDIGFGRVGRTGNYDGCRVWIVAGWSAIPWSWSSTKKESRPRMS